MSVLALTVEPDGYVISTGFDGSSKSIFCAFASNAIITYSLLLSFGSLNKHDARTLALAALFTKSWVTRGFVPSATPVTVAVDGMVNFNVVAVMTSSSLVPFKSVVVNINPLTSAFPLVPIASEPKASPDMVSVTKASTPPEAAVNTALEIVLPILLVVAPENVYGPVADVRA